MERLMRAAYSSEDGLYRAGEVLVVAGTNDISDLIDDGRLVVDSITSTKLYRRVRSAMLRDMPKALIGHSLGGAVVAQLSNDFGIPAIAMSAPYGRKSPRTVFIGHYADPIDWADSRKNAALWPHSTDGYSTDATMAKLLRLSAAGQVIARAEGLAAGELGSVKSGPTTPAHQPTPPSVPTRARETANAASRVAQPDGPYVLRSAEVDWGPALRLMEVAQTPIVQRVMELLAGVPGLEPGVGIRITEGGVADFLTGWW